MRSMDVHALPSNETKGNTRQNWWKNIALLFDQPRVVYITLGLILFIAAVFRFNGTNWDENRHLHPDERFLSTVTNDLQFPDTLDSYFDPNVSTLSPYALPNMGMFVYGTFPIYVVKGAAVILNQDTYDRITLLGRTISGLFDIASIFLLFLIGRRLYGQKAGLLAAGLISLSVLGIQLSHFYAVDTFANFFIVATIYLLLRATSSGRWLDYVLTGLLFGLGLSSKVSTLTLAAPILAAVGYDLFQRIRAGDARPALEHSLVRLVTVFFVAAVTFRVVQPIAFSGPSFLDWSLNPSWLSDINEQQKILTGNVDLPWVQQWTGRSIAFPLYNILFWGMGLPLGLAGFAGLALAGYELAFRRKFAHLLPVTYVIVTFVYHSITFVKFMRYFYPVYPFLALLAAYLLVWLWGQIPAAEGESESAAELDLETPAARLARRVKGFRLNPNLLAGITGLVVLGTLLYALAFLSIYDWPNSRITASRWIYNNIPAGSNLANEHWDDWLPIGGLDGLSAYGGAGLYQPVEMKNYEDDTPQKLDQMVANLTQADYIVLSSNRLYGSIPRLPMRYPMTTRYYNMLFNGELGFTRIAEFTSYPTIFGIRIPDQAAEESFSVYDHPRVQIFKKTAEFDPDEVRVLLGNGIPWNAVLHLTPYQASAAPKALQFTAAERSLYQRAAASSSREVNEEGWGSRIPALAWFLVLELIGLLALPVTLLAFRSLVDRGYILSKAAGLLIVGWAAWFLASLRVAPFTWWLILVVMVALLLVSFLLIRRRWETVWTFIKARWRLILLEEVLFWLLFAAFLFIRSRNPDLWHPGMGGEKPMDLAYLTAIARTPYFPAYDPWFSGGYINYYYFGFVLIATLIHLTGIVPSVAYNLAVPLLFAMTAMGAFTVVLNLAEGMQRKQDEQGQDHSPSWRALILAGVCGVLFVTVIGNLSQVQLIYNGIRGLSTIPTQDGSTWMTTLAQFFDGLSHWLADQKLTTIHTDWWYWNATRVIPPGEGEAGPINEMPIFTFLFGDLHAHAMALPYTLLVLGLAVNILRDRSWLDGTAEAWWRDPAEILTLGLLSLATGALWPVNTWDFPTYVLLAAGALALREYARRGRVDLPGLWAVAWRAGLVVALGRILFLPYHSAYAGSYFGAELWEGSQTALKPYLLIHGFFLFIIGSYLAADLLVMPGHNFLVTGLRRKLRFLHVPVDETAAAPKTAGHKVVVDLFWIALVVGLVILLLKPVIGLALLLSLLALILLLSPRPDPLRQFVRAMILLGLLLTAVVEVVVLKGDISRMNTVFKFYLQVWVLWAVGSAAVIPELARLLKVEKASFSRAPVPDVPEGSAWTPQLAAQFEALRRRPAKQTWARRWWLVFAILLGACLLYPLTAIPARLGDRFPGSTSVTLDGNAYMLTSTYHDEGRPVELKWDYQAIDWLRRNASGLPTILEANTPLYRWGSRVSINTGLPTLIGWDWHQKQQRSVVPGQIIDRRLQDVKTIYTTTDPAQAKELLQQYGITYIYLGPLERLYYPGDGLTKFYQPGFGWTPVYQNEQVTIYQVK